MRGDLGPDGYLLVRRRVGSFGVSIGSGGEVTALRLRRERLSTHTKGATAMAVMISTTICSVSNCMGSLQSLTSIEVHLRVRQRRRSGHLESGLAELNAGAHTNGKLRRDFAGVGGRFEPKHGKAEQREGRKSRFKDHGNGVHRRGIARSDDRSGSRSDWANHYK
jgi:hypothetical protein